MEKIVYLTKQEFDELIKDNHQRFADYVVLVEPWLDVEQRNSTQRIARCLYLDGTAYVEKSFELVGEEGAELINFNDVGKA